VFKRLSFFMDNFNLPPWPSFTQAEIVAVTDVLSSNKVNYWTGTKCREFEEKFAAWVGCEYAIALSNGTHALELALRALCVGPGDEVVVTPRTFIASASSIVNVGATPIFADVDLESQNISAENISAVITSRTKAVIVVHLAGRPAEMDSIMALAAKNSFFVIEDCAQAHGAKYKGVSVGTIGHIAAWSFCQDKIMSTGGEGGMVTTNDHNLWSKMWSYKDHGKSYDAVFLREHKPGFRWLHESIGSNFRMTEMQAALGIVQLDLMDEWTAQRSLNADALSSLLNQYPFLRVPKVPAYITHAHYKFYCFLVPELCPVSRDELVSLINDAGAICLQGSCSEVYKEKALEKFRPQHNLLNAEHLGETSLMFLVHPTINNEIMHRYIQRIKIALDSLDK